MPNSDPPGWESLPLSLPDERWIEAVARYYEDLVALLETVRKRGSLPAEFFVPDLWDTSNHFTERRRASSSSTSLRRESNHARRDGSIARQRRVLSNGEQLERPERHKNPDPERPSTIARGADAHSVWHAWRLLGRERCPIAID